MIASFLHRLVGATAGLLVLALGVSDCSLGDVAQDACTSNDECVDAFGIGALCGADGFCSEGGCVTNTDCHQGVGIGTACVAGTCSPVALDSLCTVYPPDAGSDLQAAAAQNVLIGALFRTGTPRDAARLAAVELAVDEIDENAGGIDNTPLALLVCNFDANAESSDDAEEAAILTEYLAGEVGVPVIIGPGSSSAALESVGVLTDGGYDTVLVSPSATGVGLSSLADRLAEDDPYGLFWRTCPSDALQGTVLAAEVSGATLSAPIVIFQNDAYGTGLRDTFREAFSGDISTVPYDRGDPGSLEAAIAAAVMDGPDAVVIVSGDATNALDLLTLAAEEPTLSGLPYFLTDGAKDREVLLTSGNAGVDAMLQNTRGTAPANPTSGNLVDDLAAQKMVDASQFSFVAHAYDAAYVVAYGYAYALGQMPSPQGRDIAAGFALLSSGPAIDVGSTQFPQGVDALRDDPPGIDLVGQSGSLTFDASTGEAPGPVEVWRINAAGDEFVTEMVVEP